MVSPIPERGFYAQSQVTPLNLNPNQAQPPKSTEASKRTISEFGQKCCEGFGQAFSNIKYFLAGKLVGRISPSLEKKLYSEADQKIQEEIQKGRKILGDIQTKISDLKQRVIARRNQFELDASQIENQPSAEEIALRNQIEANKNKIRIYWKTLAALTKELQAAVPEYDKMLEKEKKLEEQIKDQGCVLNTEIALQSMKLSTKKRIADPLEKRKAESSERLLKLEQDLEDLKSKIAQSKYLTIRDEISNLMNTQRPLEEQLTQRPLEEQLSKLEEQLSAMQKASPYGKLWQKQEEDRSALISEVTELRKEWRLQKKAIEKFKTENVPRASQYSTEFSHLNQVQKKVDAFFEMHRRILGPMDTQVFESSQRNIEDAIKRLQTVSLKLDDKLEILPLSPADIESSLKTIKDTLEQLDDLKELASIGGNKQLAKEIDAYCKYMRSLPLVSTNLTENAKEQLDSLNSKIETLVVRPDAVSTVVKRKIDGLQKQKTALLQAALLHASSRKDYTKQSEAQPLTSESVRATRKIGETSQVIVSLKTELNILKGDDRVQPHQDLLRYVDLLDQAVDELEKIGLNSQEDLFKSLEKDLKDIATAVAMIKTESLHRKTLETLQNSTNVLSRELLQLKETIESATQNDTTLTTTPDINPLLKWIKIKPREFGLRFLQGTSEEAKEAVSLILNRLKKVEDDKNLDSNDSALRATAQQNLELAKEIRELMDGNPWIQAVKKELDEAEKTKPYRNCS